MAPLIVSTLLACLALSHAVPVHESISHTTLLSSPADVKEEYDYIVVGGGTAGLTVADRLTESGEYTVLVIEAGTFDNTTGVNRVAFGNLGLQNASHLFSFPSVPQVGLHNRTTNVVVGKLLGGSSAVNGMQVQRGHRDDYDSWGAYFGDSSDWSWDGLLPYFRKAWHFVPPEPTLAAAFDMKYDVSFWGNTSGVYASFPSFQWPMLKTEVAAFAEIEGAEFPPDSGAGLPGVYWYPTNTVPGNVTRSYSRTGHWDWIQRPNYETITGQRVFRLDFDGTRAVSVQFIATGADSTDDPTTVKAKKEIVLAAGAIHTPQILQASGIGPKAVLDAAGVGLLVDLPGVGNNFQDHPVSGGASFNLRNFTISPKPSDIRGGNATFMQAAQDEFSRNRTGPFSIASGNAGSFLPLPVIAPDAFERIAAEYEAQGAADYLPEGAAPAVVEGYAAQQKYHAKAMRSLGSAYYNLFLQGGEAEGAIVHLHPTSRGTVYISDDPYIAEPVVDYRALSNPTDLAILAEFTRFTRRYWLNTSLVAFEPVESSPGAALVTDEELYEGARRMVSPTTFHPVGTAAMMPRELAGVVDEDLLVYGVEGLSVVDASIMPTLPGAYTQQTAYAIAEKAADKIKARA